MASGRIPGPLGGDKLLGEVQDGTSALAPSPTPGPLGVTPAPGSTVAAAWTSEDGASRSAAAAATEKDSEIEALDLADSVKKAAYPLKKAHPSVTFTSGRRSKEDQARAMAGNVVQNRKWLEQTYAKSTARDKCQKWVDDNPDKKTKDEIEAGLIDVLNGLTEANLAHLSKHLSGEAFDVQPVDTDAEKIKKTIRNLPGLQKFLDTEGGLTRWHAQF